MFDRFKSLLNIGNRAKSVDTPATPFSYTPTLGYYNDHCGSYDNTFPSISRIAETFMTVLPYAINDKGERLSETPQLLRAIYNPNKQTSGVKFFEQLAVMTLVHPQVHLLCWRREGGRVLPGGNITTKNIDGFTFLENANVTYGNGRRKIHCNGRTYDESEVVTLSLNANPYSINSGYSPSKAAKKWSNIDDYIADYQSGYFRNGAVPAGEFIITAATVDDYNDTVNMLKRKHRGAGANNNVVYAHRPISQIDGKPTAAQIEWIPFETKNSDMGLQALFEQANKKIDMDFGVPQEVKGYIQNSNYASVSTADYIFRRFVIYPKLVKIWGDFTHEMNRITGGLGFAISFDYELPIMADEDKVRAETRLTELNTLNTATLAGYTLESAVEALGLPTDFLKLSQAVSVPSTTNSEPTTTDQPEDVEEIVEEETKCLDHAKKKSLSDSKVADPELIRTIEEEMLKEIEATIAEQDLDSKKDDAEFVDALMVVLTARMLMAGATQYDSGKLLLLRSAINPGNGTGYYVDNNLRNSYKRYLKDVAASYNADTRASIQRVLDQAQTLGWDKRQLADNLRNIMNTDEWRVQRLALSETHRATSMADLDAMAQLQDEAGVKFAKTWRVNPATTNHCGDCESMNGQTMPLDNAFISLGEDFPTGRSNGFVDVESADAHPNCTCYLQFSVIGTPKTVKVECPSCGRYLFETDGGKACNVKCMNGKCKKKFDFEVSGGKVTATERVENGS